MPGTFVLSLDKELVWGSFDHTSDETFARQNPDTRGMCRRLLDLLDEYEIPATWAVVGHLFLRSCERGADGRPHPEIVRPRHAFYKGEDWLERDPCSNREHAPLWYGDDILDDILARRTRHEIGCHSFTHMVYGDPGCSREAAASDLDACMSAAKARGISLKSFIFPRNVEGHHEELRKRGFTSYRGEDPTWFNRLHGPARRLGHLSDQFLGVAPPLVTAYEASPGLVNIPGSMCLLHRSGIRRYVSPEASIHKGVVGARAAGATGKIFHLWFHPFNLASSDVLFDVLRGMFAEVAAERARGRLVVKTMNQIAEDVLAQSVDAGLAANRAVPRPESHSSAR